MSLAGALDRAAEALPALADAIVPANGDPERLLAALDAEQARAVLTFLLAEAPDDAEALVAEWVDHEAGRTALAALDEGSLTKPGRKLLRRVRHRLRSRGVALPEVPPAPRVAKLPEVDPDVAGAFVSPVDPSGARVVVIVDANPSGGARIFEVVADELRGIRRCDVYQAPRGKARRFLREATGRAGGAGVPVSPGAARAYLARVAAGQPADRSLPRAFSEWRSQLTRAPEGTATPGEEAAAGLPAPTEDDRKRLLEMIGQGLVGPWPPPEASLRPALEAFTAEREAKIVVTGARRRERLEEILSDAAEAAYTKEFSERTAARFAESAYVFWRTGREDEARACLAGARAFREGEVRSNPVARALLGHLLAPLLQEPQEGGPGNEEHERESESLLVKP